jgi:hypothetical protein
MGYCDLDVATAAINENTAQTALSELVAEQAGSALSGVRAAR